jgi:TPR repeat protein
LENAYGAESLAHLSRDDRAMAKDIKEAKWLYQKAVDLGSTNAAAALAALH